MFDDSFDVVTTPNPDASLFKLIARRDRLLADGDEIKSRTLLWELIHRSARTVEGHQAKLKMIAGIEFDQGDLVIVAWNIAHEAGRLGINSSMPILRSRAAPRMVAAG